MSGVGSIGNKSADAENISEEETVVDDGEKNGAWILLLHVIRSSLGTSPLIHHLAAAARCRFKSNNFTDVHPRA